MCSNKRAEFELTLSFYDGLFNEIYEYGYIIIIRNDLLLKNNNNENCNVEVFFPTEK